MGKQFLHEKRSCELIENFIYIYNWKNFVNFKFKIFLLNTFFKLYFDFL